MLASGKQVKMARASWTGRKPKAQALRLPSSRRPRALIGLTIMGRFVISGKTVTAYVNVQAGTSNLTTTTVTSPTTVFALSNYHFDGLLAYAVDNSTPKITPCRYSLSSETNVINCYSDLASGTWTQKSASFLTDGADGILQYITIAGDIDESGIWYVQGYVETTLGKFFTEKARFTVYDTLYVENPII